MINDYHPSDLSTFIKKYEHNNEFELLPFPPLFEFKVYNHFLKEKKGYLFEIKNQDVSIFSIKKLKIILKKSLSEIFYIVGYFEKTYKKKFQEAVQLCFEFLIFEKYSANTVTLSDFSNILNLKKKQSQKKVRVIIF